tara:strand:- start:2863 stop:3780 length:918 start_codon:yes stop_codon:yes gene_type:complete
MFDLKFDYGDCVSHSERVSWSLDDVMEEGQALDFTKPFLPRDLVRHVADLDGLDEPTRLRLNQIAGNAYLNLFQFVEEYILATMMEHAQAEVFGDVDALRALTRMVDEELKHQQLFHRFRRSFDRDFGHRCGVLESAAAVAQVIMSHSPLAVMLITLHIEWMTQQHYTESVRKDESIDPFFKSLLRHHWLEESQHARIDMLETRKIASYADQEARDQAVSEYLAIVEAFDGLLADQVDLDVASLDAGAAVERSPEADGALRTAIHQSYRRTFLWYGMTNKNVVDCLQQLSPDGARKVADHAGRFA